MPRRLSLALLVAILLGLGACVTPTPPTAPPNPAASAAPSAAPSTPRASAAPASSASASPGAVLPPPAPPPKPISAKATVKNDPAWATCHQSYDPKKKDPAKDVAAMAKGCAKVTGMKLEGTPLAGKQSDQDPPQSFPLRAEANHCYRVYAQASDGIRDLDLAIKDSTGAVAGEDSTDDASPVILEDGAVCFTEADAATLVVSVGLGKGTYAIEIWSD